MHDDLTLPDINGAATARLLGPTWASYLQQTCARLRAAGQEARKSDGTHALVARLRRTRPSTYQHCLRAARNSRLIGRALGFDQQRLQQLSAAAMMHDIGKILVPETFLSRPRRPTRFEQFVLRLHPSFGALLASYFDLPVELRVRTEHHHERWDGRGYPHGLGGTDIPLMARIVQVADSYDAMIERRAYNRPRTHESAVAELRAEAGKQFDPRVVEAFLDSHPGEAA
jgi:HD-GYP domain-containing protein (c-di-GMP phosphodiesterase class II)